MNGWINLNKPVGITSAQAVSRIKRALPKGTKIGHAGTLDPLADGVLPLAIGEATKLISLLHMDEKSYRSSIIWGEERTTGDAEGDVTLTSDIRPSRADIENILPQFRGNITQVPPMYSAIKIDGERAYDRARAGEEVDMPSRQVDIFDLKIISHCHPELDAGSPAISETNGDSRFRGNDNSLVTFLECTCGTGTYVRSIARDIARACGSAGYVGLLTRLHVGPFAIDNAFLLDKDNRNVDKEVLQTALLPMDYGLDDILAVPVSRHEEARLRQGQSIITQSTAFADPVLIRGENGLVGIGVWDNRTLKPKRLLNL